MADELKRLGFEDLYQARCDEIKDTIRFLLLIDKSVTLLDENGDTLLRKMQNGIIAHLDREYIDTTEISFDYIIVANSLRANIYLMIYNLIEFSVSNLLTAVYDEIRKNKCSFQDVSEELRVIWHRCKLSRITRNREIKNESIEKISRELLDSVINNTIIELEARDTLPGGNLDGERIKRTIESHGIRINNLNSTYRPDVFERIKNKRNELAHGSSSFSEAGSQVTISDLELLLNTTTMFLDQLILDTRSYIQTKQYLGSVS